MLPSKPSQIEQRELETPSQLERLSLPEKHWFNKTQRIENGSDISELLPK